jgi:predicted transcriptional regulator
MKGVSFARLIHAKPIQFASPYCIGLRRTTIHYMAKQTMTIRIEPDVRSSLDAVAAATDRDRTWVVNEALKAYLETYQWQIEHIQQGVREANAGKFAPASEVKRVIARLRRK